jgi:hypothetical protein
MESAKENTSLVFLSKEKKNKRLEKSIWATWIAKLMAGESLCSWPAWFKTHYAKYEKAPLKPELIKYLLVHSRMIDELKNERLAKGEKVFVEGANRFSLEIEPTLTLAGKPDLIALSKDTATVYECKSEGQKYSHQVQLMIYLYCLPRCLDQYKNMKLEGCLLYHPSNKVEIHQCMIDQGFIGNLNYWLKILGSDIPPAKTPSENECSFCDFAKTDCQERIEKTQPRIKQPN